MRIPVGPIFFKISCSFFGEMEIGAPLSSWRPLQVGAPLSGRRSLQFGAPFVWEMLEMSIDHRSVTNCQEKRPNLMLLASANFLICRFFWKWTDKAFLFPYFNGNLTFPSFSCL